MRPRLRPAGICPGAETFKIPCHAEPNSNVRLRGAARPMAAQMVTSQAAIVWNDALEAVGSVGHLHVIGPTARTEPAPTTGTLRTQNTEPSATPPKPTSLRYGHALASAADPAVPGSKTCITARQGIRTMRWPPDPAVSGPYAPPPCRTPRGCRLRHRWTGRRLPGHTRTVRCPEQRIHPTQQAPSRRGR